MVVSNEDRFPFDCIIVTSPDEASARSALGPVDSVLQKRLRKHYPNQNVRIVSTYDPFGARCGSGGGTLAALQAYATPEETVLVLHAGGDSSRCPTQMIMGKAWTSIPSSQYRNPTIWLIDQLQRLYEQAHFPKGTCVVAATDCLATFFERRDLSTVDWEYEYADESVVLGVGVPAPVTTAKNHGVYVMSEGISNNTYKLGIEDPLDVWQKPTVDQLVNTVDPAPSSFTIWRHKERQAWIDTGIVVFLPKAVQTLYDLADGILARCTRKGLEAAYEISSKDQTLQSFAKANALKIDLYTDILHNLKWPSQTLNVDKSPLRKALSTLPLQVLVAPQGRFLHLGTTQELSDFITSGAFPDDIRDRNNTIAALARYFSLQPRYRCWKDPLPFAHNVVLQSTFPEDSSLGRRSFTEYSDLADYDRIHIGENTMLSGWRNPTNDTSALRIPSNLGIQLLQLRPEEDGANPLFAYMVFGMKDGIKEGRSKGTIYGMPVQQFLARTGLSLEQMGWSEGNESEDCIWTAKIQPKVPIGTSFGSVFGWLLELLESDRASIASVPSLRKWISMPRVSLKELHSLADAEAEWAFRQDLEKKVLDLEKTEFIPYMRRLLKERVHDNPLDLQWLVEMDSRQAAKAELFKIIPALEDVVREELRDKRYDVCGRAFMIASALLADFDSHRPQDDCLTLEISKYCDPLIQQLRSNSTQEISIEEQLVAFNAITTKREETMGLRSLVVHSSIMERLAFCMNEWSVAMGFRASKENFGKQFKLSGSSEIVIGKWVMAAAPARADLAGAWSDTPPVCYEYGGSVTGMAILVDNHMPLSCRCRMVPGKKGVLLRTEGRDSVDGSLKYFLDADIEKTSDMEDFRNPLSDCALVKAALVCLGMVSEGQIREGAELQPLINRFCSSKNEDVRIEIVTSSLLPHGSGLGTSSILGGCILASIAKCVGLGELDSDYLLHAVLMLEQLLSSGGGWQDQAHGILPGIKTVRSKPAQLPLVMSVEQLDVESTFIEKFQKRMILVFTGKTRLAKNILQNVLRRWSRRTDEVVCGIEKIVKLSERCRQSFLEGDLDGIGDELYECSKMKVVMTGEDSGAIPPTVEKVIADLMDRDIIKGASLCGAGGGGFMMMLASEGYDRTKVEEYVNKELVRENPDLAHFTWHNCRVCTKGLTTHVIDEPDINLESFKLSWQLVA